MVREPEWRAGNAAPVCWPANHHAAPSEDPITTMSLRPSRGFTLVELMIVLVVLGILAAIAIPNMILMTARAKEAGTKSNMHTLQVAAEDYAVAFDGYYSTILDATHIADRLPQNFRNPFSGASGTGAWEDRASMNSDPNPVPGISSYADSLNNTYNIKGFGRLSALLFVVTQGQ